MRDGWSNLFTIYRPYHRHGQVSAGHPSEIAGKDFGLVTMIEALLYERAEKAELAVGTLQTALRQQIQVWRAQAQAYAGGPLALGFAACADDADRLLSFKNHA